GTRTNNGSSGGTFRGIGGVYTAERRLRLLMGVPITSEQLIKPVTEPILAPVDFNWQAMLSSSISTRPELKRQRQIVKRLVMQLEANRNFLKPRFDAVAQYRWRGFGKDLISGADVNGMGFDDAYSNLIRGDYQEWHLGVELSFPIGFRQAHAAVRHSELALAQQRAILHEQEREIVHNLSNALGDLERTTAVAQINYNRLVAASQRVAALNNVNNLTEATPSDLLDAQTRLSDAQSRYYLALVEYMVALRNVHLEKGSLLEYRGVYLADTFDSEQPVEELSDISIDVTEVPDPRIPIRESYEQQKSMVPEIVEQPYDPQPLSTSVINPVGYQTLSPRTGRPTLPLKPVGSFKLAEHELDPSSNDRVIHNAVFEQSTETTDPATLLPQLEEFEEELADGVDTGEWEVDPATTPNGKRDVIYE
ncbi:MAG TPA: TolC family protein, partial [Planctomycetaceae bacterium]|nr:TolC family protein [Planctomycetaceae bacterium]